MPYSLVLLIAITLSAFALTALFAPFAITAAKRFGLVDDPKKRHHPAHTQQRIIPRAGGLAIYFGIIFTSLLFIPLEKHLFGIFAGITTLLIIGLLDDLLPKFNPYIRLVLLFVAAAMAVGSGIGISFITNPLSGIAGLGGFWQTSAINEFTTNVIRLDQIVIPINFIGQHQIIILADVFAFFWIVTLTQVINWSKGVDGQMPGITLIAALTLGLFSYKLTLEGDANQLNIAKLSFIVAGTSLGFLIYNWHPAKILPGFSGSTILAFMLATLSILSGAKVATAALVLAVPFVDFIYTITRRILAKRSPVWGDRGHLHHKLLDLGWSHQKISLFYILGSVILGAVALFASTQSKLFAIVIVATVFIVFILWLDSFGGLSKQQDPGNGQKTLPSLPD